jgi:hypothetical protein
VVASLGRYHTIREGRGPSCGPEGNA